MINADVEGIYEYIPVGTPVWIGSDARLADYGISQYYTIVEPPEPEEEEIIPELEPEPDNGPPERDPERAEYLPLTSYK
jgi:hypothetical protein